MQQHSQDSFLDRGKYYVEILLDIIQIAGLGNSIFSALDILVFPEMVSNLVGLILDFPKFFAVGHFILMPFIAANFFVFKAKEKSRKALLNRLVSTYIILTVPLIHYIAIWNNSGDSLLLKIITISIFFTAISLNLGERAPFRFLNDISSSPQAEIVVLFATQFGLHFLFSTLILFIALLIQFENVRETVEYVDGFLAPIKLRPVVVYLATLYLTFLIPFLGDLFINGKKS